MDLFIADRFTVADACLVPALNWAAPGGVDLKRWPVLADWQAEQLQRPALARAVGEELTLRAAA
jgi:glutathione S-transferase